ncbi:YopX family protein [Geomicrobium sp. JCM 19055]|uniref:YopX family protein n=1 Tax=Geomicrobium sp. JCM 19055 TaxID=1460649 RepID=UPI0006943AE5|nr:YopX family protein [Geomicrobium sp. JCM 19055]
MSRYKFRGKATSVERLDELEISHKNGWVYGSLIWNNGSPFIVGDIGDHDEDFIQPEWWMPVIPESVGQYTGLCDKHGTEIFEGDVIQYTLPDEGKTRTLDVKSVNGQYRTDRSTVYAVHRICEIIGNIYENKDLLEA